MSRVDLPSSSPSDLATVRAVSPVAGQFLPVTRLHWPVQESRRRRAPDVQAITSRRTEPLEHPYLTSSDIRDSDLAPFGRVTSVEIIAKLLRIESALGTVELSGQGELLADRARAALLMQRSRFALASGLQPGALEGGLPARPESPVGDTLREVAETEAATTIPPFAVIALEPSLERLLVPLALPDRELLNAIAAYLLRYGEAHDAAWILLFTHGVWPQDAQTLRLLSHAYAALGDFGSAASSDRAYRQSEPAEPRQRVDLLRQAVIVARTLNLGEATRLAWFALSSPPAGIR